MKDYDAKNISLEINGKALYGFGDPDIHFVKDNSKENQDRLSDDFKYAQSQPIPSKRVEILYNYGHVQIPEKYFSDNGKWIE